MAPTQCALTERAAALIAARPGLSADTAYREVLAGDPALARRHHEGADQAPQSHANATPLVDAGALLLEQVAALVAAGLPERQARAEAFAASPGLVAAWHRGEAVPRPGAAPVASPGPRLLRFRAALDGDVAGDELVRVPIFRVGTWNGQKYGPSDLAAMARAFEAGHYEVPLKLGHSDAPDAPAVGRVSRLRVEGDTLLADFADLDPAVLDGIRRGRWLSLSCEVYIDLKRNGVSYPAALRSIALLGAHPPGVDLPPLREALV